MQEGERWDIFCRVVDNFGDVGVSWRLARALATEHGKSVRLFVDDFTVLAKLRPEVDEFFDRVMVMADQEDIRRNRLTLLSELLSEFSTIADFSEIVTAAEK